MRISSLTYLAAYDFSLALVQEHRRLNWAASVHPLDLIRGERLHTDFLGTLARSGCRRLLMGVESGSDRVLHNIRKGVCRNQILDVARQIAKEGIIGSYTLIVGFPGETQTELEETFSLASELRALARSVETRVHVFAPYPGTPLYEKALLNGFQPPTGLAGWSHYDYYTSMTPWTDEQLVQRARAATYVASQRKVHSA